ncbi:MAG: extracellular solute-binding protein [Chloroflexi bacterium]|nr:extracellular solute-binding protein [Chloroflexota bacterium]MCI0645043.1 extracellular solute-binding protein [Chloroflexota bacterium]
MSSKRKFTRREFLKNAGVAAAGLTLAGCGAQGGGAAQPTEAPAEPTAIAEQPTVAAAAPTSAPAVKQPIELIHWSWLTASDGEVWAQMINDFNEAYQDKGIQIKMDVIGYDEFNTKVLAGVAAGQAPDFGWGGGGLRAQWIKDGALVPLDDLVAKVGLDLSDFTEQSLKGARYPKFDNKLFLIPMDAMSLQMEVNTDHVKEAGLDISKPPDSNEDLLEWAKAMTRLEGDKVVRSGILMTGSGVQPTVTWGIVSAQMGFKRASDDLKTAAINPEAGKAAMQWILDLFDKHKVSTRDVTDRYKAFGTGEGSMFWTGPWTIQGYVDQKLNFVTVPFPKIGQERHTYFELGGLELYPQKDSGRYEATMEAIKWLSDNSFLWTTKGRGAATRKSILARDDYNTAGHPWEVRGAFIEGMEYATLAPIPILNADDFEIYSGGNFLATVIAAVIAGEKTVDQMMDELTEKWQEDLDIG